MIIDVLLIDKPKYKELIHQGLNGNNPKLKS